MQLPRHGRGPDLGCSLQEMLRICRRSELCPHTGPRDLKGHVWRESWCSHLCLGLPDKGSHMSGPGALGAGTKAALSARLSVDQDG